MQHKGQYHNSMQTNMQTNTITLFSATLYKIITRQNIANLYINTYMLHNRHKIIITNFILST
ncbi:hypothetical protein CAXC1_150027 [Candidatus Xenohaliotis californiensis]|uniref:Uncharacterized protein n=1 Tax=Candidatus Xenohaliotis californiensis TaxID=84677 RepID=A0ABM9N771_9RICK|nr:hypothetical protein CAXC1_150027 [Candidatus Xenohaliotis californiensis]